MRPALTTLILLFIATATLAQESHLGDVTIRSDGDRVVVLLDTTLDASAPTDGVVDQSFVLQIGGPVLAPLSVHLSNALVVHTPRALRVTTATQRYEFVLDGESAAPAATRVIGIAHHTGADVLPRMNHDDCAAGGPGATSCKLSTRANRCDVVCASGYYACGAVRENVADCACVKSE
jgi:hypothetical protein